MQLSLDCWQPGYAYLLLVVLEFASVLLPCHPITLCIQLHKIHAQPFLCIAVYHMESKDLHKYNNNIIIILLDTSDANVFPINPTITIHQSLAHLSSVCFPIVEEVLISSSNFCTIIMVFPHTYYSPSVVLLIFVHGITM